MTEEQNIDAELEDLDSTELEELDSPEEEMNGTEELDGTEEYEEISGEEVDRIVESLEVMMESVESENIKAYLDEALNSIYYLVHDDEEDEGEDEMPIAEAA